MKRLACWTAVVVLLASAGYRAQEREDRTLLNWSAMRAIINETSGERALQHVLEMVPYPRVRSRAEFEGHFRESQVMAQFARDYGFSNVEIESVPQSGRTWYASQAELWVTSPDPVKLYDVHDVAVSVVSGSELGDVTADLVDVGTGARADDYAGKDVKGKIVLGSASASTLQRLAVFDRGAAGVVSYNPIHPEADIDEIGSQSIQAAPEGKTTGFGWSVSPRVGRDLAGRLGRGENVTLRSIVKSETFPNRMEIVHAIIPGDGSSTEEVAVSAHLYEGYIKQGANDDDSGCAMTLEMGRVLLRLVADGKLPRPKRTIHFLWVPEISGTEAWLTRHEDVSERLIADLNFDMEGLRLATNSSFWVMHRTPDTFPSFLNDVGQSVLEFVANLNRERVRYRTLGYTFTLPVVSENGSRDPFYVLVDKHYGASDHVVYMNHGIPSLMFITWPDPYYHSSHDTPDKLDSTQLKRAAVVGLGALTVLASADDTMAARVAAEVLARGTERIGSAERKGLAYLADLADPGGLADAFKEARNAVRHQTDIEKAALRTSAVLFPSPAEAEKRLAPFESLIDQRAAALQNEVKAYYRLQADQRKVPAAEPAMTEAEQKASRTAVERAPGTAGFGGFGRMQQAIEKLPESERKPVQQAMAKVPQHMTAELAILAGKNKTVLEIRDFLSGEFEPLPLGDLMAFLQAQEKMGMVKLVEKPAQTKGVPKRK